MAATTRTENVVARTNAEYGVISKAELDTPVTFEELTGAMGDFLPDVTFLSSPYEVLKGDDKYKLLDMPFYVRSWRESVDKETGNPFTILYLVTAGNEAYILTDGSTGIHAQLQTITADRIAKGHGSPIDNLLVANGLRVSEYGVTAEGKPAKEGEKVVSKGATFYLS